MYYSMHCFWYYFDTISFPIRIPDCDSHSPALLDLFINSDASICSTVAFPPLGNFDFVADFTVYLIMWFCCC